MAETKAIYGALLAVQKGLASIPKNGKMKFGGTEYDYLKADDVQEKINPLLSEHGVIVQSEYGVDSLEKGNRHWLYVNLALTYIATEDGSSLTVRAVGESIAGDDKSINKALTQAIKNAHRSQFQFASGESEPDDYVPSAGGSSAKQSPAARKIEVAKAPASGDNEYVSAIKSWVQAGAASNGETLTGPEANAVAGRLFPEDKSNAWRKDAGKSQQVHDAILAGERK